MAAACLRSGTYFRYYCTLGDLGLTRLSREIMKHVLNFPANTRVEFKSHDSSIQQRTAIDEQRREKQQQGHTERRGAATSRQTNE